MSLIKIGDINLSGITKPIAKLIGAIQSAAGAIYAPTATVRQARADAQALVIMAEAEGEAAATRERTYLRLTHQEISRQKNIDRIAGLATQELPPNVDDKPVDQDWMTQFLRLAQDVSDEKMQSIWARILAGEVTSPGRYSKRTLQFLESMEKHEAEAFTKLSSLFVKDSANWYYLFGGDYMDNMMKQADLAAGYISHFEVHWLNQCRD